MNLSNFTPFINTVGFIVLALAIWYSQYKTKSGEIGNQALANYKTLTEQQKEKLAAKDEQIAQYQRDMGEIKKAMSVMKEDFAKQIGELQGQINAKDKHIADLTATVHNRNPELEKVLGEIRDFMKELNQTNLHQTLILERGVVRNEGIDLATENEEGKVMRNN